MPTISEIAKEKGVSRSTAERRMKGCPSKPKKVAMACAGACPKRTVLVANYLAADVAKAFPKKKAAKK